jgi:hypothetical protein
MKLEKIAQLLDLNTTATSNNSTTVRNSGPNMRASSDINYNLVAGK